jgi:site-specific recombinase XerD
LFELFAVLNQSGKLPQEREIKLKPKFLTVSEVGEGLIEDWKQKAENGDIASATFDDYCLRLKQIKDAFKGLLVCEIRKKDILDYRTRLSKEISNATSNRNLFIIKQLMNFAISQGVIHDSPSDGIKYLK